MDIPRLSDTLVMNNVWLLSLATVLVLLGFWLGLVGGTAVLRWLFRQARVRALEEAAGWLSRLSRTLAIAASTLTVVAAIALLAYGIWKNVDFHEWVAALGPYLTTENLWLLGQRIAATIGLIIAFFYAFRVGKKLLPSLEKRLVRTELLKDHRESLAALFEELPQCLTLVIVYIVIHPLVETLGFPGWLAWLAITVSFIAVVANVSRLAVTAGKLALEVFDAFMTVRTVGRTIAVYYNETRRLLPLAKRTIEAIVYLAATMLIIRQFETIESFAPYGAMIIEVVAVFFVGRLIIELTGVLVQDLMTPKAHESDTGPSDDAPPVANEEARRRRETLTVLLQRLLKAVIYVAMAMIMLVIIGVDPVPLLAGAGIVGFAVGLGSQRIIQDVISGFFMLFENQMLLGDYIKIGDTEGVVEGLFLRVTRIRDRLGRLHTLRNGDIENVINYSRGWTLAIVEMSVAYEADLPKVIEVMNEVGRMVQEQLPDDVLEPARIMGIEAMDDSCLRVRIEATVREGCHYAVKRVLNRLLFEAFRDNELEIPYPKAIEFDKVPE